MKIHPTRGRKFKQTNVKEKLGKKQLKYERNTPGSFTGEHHRRLIQFFKEQINSNYIKYCRAFKKFEIFVWH